MSKIAAQLPPFPLGNTAIALSQEELSQQVNQLNTLLHQDRNFYGQCVQKLFRELIKLRGKNHTSPDRLVLGWDSVGDLVSLYIFAEEAVHWGAHVHVVYFRTIYNDDARLAQQFLQPLTQKGIEIDFLDDMEYSEEVRFRSLDVFFSTNPTFSITNLSDAYDIRHDINRAQQLADKTALSYDPRLDLDLRTNGLEIPALSLTGLISPMFEENHQIMKKRGNACLSLLAPYEFVHITASDGTDLLLKVLHHRWINEANLDFTLRADDYQKHPELYESSPPICDNPPGEIYTGIGTSEGTLVLYQLDTDVVDYGYRHIEIFGKEIAAIPRLTLTYNPTDPISMEVKDGKIVLSSIQGKSIRAKLLQEYFKAVIAEDNIATLAGDVRYPNAALHVSELGLGINSQANNPEELVHEKNIFSVVITEKRVGVWHLAIGAFPLSDPLYKIRSISHLDNGLRNADLRVYGVKLDGTQELLTGSLGGNNTTFETALHN